MNKVALLAIIILFLFQLVSTVAEPALKTKVTADGVLVTEGDAKVLFYQRATKSMGGKHARANYVHPLFDLDGNVLTEDFPADHLHHRGIFWAWHQLWGGNKMIGDGWIAKDMTWDVHDLQTSHLTLRSLHHHQIL